MEPNVLSFIGLTMPSVSNINIDQCFLFTTLFFFQDLSHNKLITLTPGVGFLNRLKHVNLSNNELHSIPHELTAVCGMVISLLLCHFVLSSIAESTKVTDGLIQLILKYHFS